ncbi:MAG: hypothetical protein KF886_24210 [Candidatus Hydrogenedentes bacterium]|nr:hypothetical protein [Candidatus Hydrogenedentota bacterium]
MLSALLVAAAALTAAGDSPDWAFANTLLAEHERNAALSADCAFTFKEFRSQIFFKGKVKTEADIEAVVEVARRGEDLLVKRNETTNVKREDGSLDTLRLDLVKNGDYIAHSTSPGTHIELFYHDRPGPAFDPNRGANAIPRALGVGPHKCGFGDGHSPLAGILWAAREAASELTCKPVREGEPLYALEITRPSGVFSRIIVDASKGALIVSAVKLQDDRKLSELEVVPGRFQDLWFPKSWKRTKYDKAGNVLVYSSSELTDFSNSASSIDFTYASILPSEETPVIVFDNAGEMVHMYSVDGVLVDRALAGVARQSR